MLGFGDPLCGPVDRILVAGPSGVGKTMLCRQIGAALDIPVGNIDGLHWGPQWTTRPEFAADVDRFTSGPAWVIEWGYREVKPILRDRADLVVWLNHPRRTVVSRVVRRTVARRLRRVELWNGNLEPPLWTILTDHDHIVRWSWRVYGKYPAALPAPLPIVRLVGQRQVDAWLAGPLTAARATRSNQEVPSSPPPEE